MYLFSAVMLLSAAAVLFLAVRIYRGGIGLVMSHHTKRVTDAAGYCKLMGISLAIIGAGIGTGGIFVFFGESHTVFVLSLSSLALGITLGITGIIVAQIKYNGGIF